MTQTLHFRMKGGYVNSRKNVKAIYIYHDINYLFVVGENYELVEHLKLDEIITLKLEEDK